MRIESRPAAHADALRVLETAPRKPSSAASSSGDEILRASPSDPTIRIPKTAMPSPQEATTEAEPLSAAKTFVKQVVRPLGPLTRFWQGTPDRVDPQQVLSQATAIAVLASLHEERLRSAIAEGKLQVTTANRDEQVALHGRVVFVLSGQMGIGLFTAEVLSEEISFRKQCDSKGYEGPEVGLQRSRQRGPLGKESVANHRILEPGDCVCENPVLKRLANRQPEASHIVVYSITPVTLCLIDAALTEDWGRLDPRFRADFEALQLRSLQPLSGHSVTTDLYVRHGVSVARTLRVLDTDRCIGCRDCERACQERHGEARLQISGPVVGQLMLTETCRTCTDQRCVAACGYDAIAFDPDVREVMIKEDKCVGCSYCQSACPYGAIKMVDLAGTPYFVEKMGKRSARVRLPMAPPDLHPLTRERKRVASKCDHCASYSDQACISACSHEALFEVKPQALFFRTTRADQAFDRGGKSPVREIAELRNSEQLPLSLLAARTPRPAPWLQHFLMWSLMLLPVMGLYFAALLSGRHLTHSHGAGLWGGIAGWAALLLTWAFPIAARLPALRNQNRSDKVALLLRLLTHAELHAAAGTAGFVLILLHARFLPTARSPLALLAFVLLGLASGTGLLMRLMPRLVSRGVAAAQSHRERIQRHLNENSAVDGELRKAIYGFTNLDSDLLRRTLSHHPAVPLGLRGLRVLRGLMGGLRFLWLPLPKALERGGVIAGPLLRSLRGLLLAQRIQQLLPAFLELRLPLRYVHIASAVLFSVLSLGHVVQVLAHW